MTEEVFVLYTAGADGVSHLYGVFSSEEAAQDARTAIIKELEETAREHGGEEALADMHKIGGTLDEETQIKRYELRDEFDGDPTDLFEDPDAL